MSHSKVRIAENGPMLMDGPVDIVMPDGSIVCSERFRVVVCLCKRRWRWHASLSTPSAVTGEHYDLVVGRPGADSRELLGRYVGFVVRDRIDDPRGHGLRSEALGQLRGLSGNRPSPPLAPNTSIRAPSSPVMPSTERGG